ncbi:MAG: hypothetical protein RLO10_05915, partial [Roseovarius indicus]
MESLVRDSGKNGQSHGELKGCRTSLRPDVANMLLQISLRGGDGIAGPLRSVCVTGAGSRPVAGA